MRTRKRLITLLRVVSFLSALVIGGPALATSHDYSHAIGLAVDLVHRYAPADWHPRWRAVATGVGFGLAFYLVVLFALTAFYPETDQVWHLDYFQGGIYFTLPWMLVNGGFAGYTAYAISRQE